MRGGVTQARSDHRRQDMERKPGPDQYFNEPALADSSAASVCLEIQTVDLLELTKA